MAILILAFILNITFIKYRNFRELKDINEAKTKIINTFFLSANSSLKFQKKEHIKLDLSSKKIIVMDYLERRKKVLNLPKNLIYWDTHPSFSKSLDIYFTKNGNISKSFSVYIFDSRKNVRYKISFYGFDRSKFLKINAYRKFSNNKITLTNILKYHETTNEDRKSFYKDWKRE